MQQGRGTGNEVAFVEGEYSIRRYCARFFIAIDVNFKLVNYLNSSWIVIFHRSLFAEIWQSTC